MAIKGIRDFPDVEMEGRRGKDPRLYKDEYTAMKSSAGSDVPRLLLDASREE
jgi:hypothetical protein